MAFNQKMLIGGVVLAAAGLVAGGWWINNNSVGDQFAQCRSSVVSGGMDAFGDAFTLTNGAGERVTDTQVFDRPSLLYFGYTFCPDVCPLDNARNAAAIDILKESGKDAQAVFVTVDPARDTPERVAEFTELFSADMIGLTGSLEETDAASKAWRNYYKLKNKEDKEYYLVDHMTKTFLVFPEKGTVEFFNRDVSPEKMAEQVACFIDAAA